MLRFNEDFSARHRCWVSVALDHAFAVTNPVLLDILSVDISFPQQIILLRPLSFDASLTLLSWACLSLGSSKFWQLFLLTVLNLPISFSWQLLLTAFLLTSVFLEVSFPWCLFVMAPLSQKKHGVLAVERCLFLMAKGALFEPQHAAMPLRQVKVLTRPQLRMQPQQQHASSPFGGAVPLGWLPLCAAPGR